MRAIDYNGHVPASTVTEAQLYLAIEQMCEDLGLLWTRNPDSRRALGSRGFPDYVITGPCGTLFREVKDATNTLSSTQRRWSWALMAGHENWGTWRPRDLESGRIKFELEQLTARYRECA